MKHISNIKLKCLQNNTIYDVFRTFQLAEWFAVCLLIASIFWTCVFRPLLSWQVHWPPPLSLPPRLPPEVSAAYVQAWHLYPSFPSFSGPEDPIKVHNPHLYLWQRTISKIKHPFAWTTKCLQISLIIILKVMNILSPLRDLIFSWVTWLCFYVSYFHPQSHQWMSWGIVPRVQSGNISRKITGLHLIRCEYYRFHL